MSGNSLIGFYEEKEEIPEVCYSTDSRPPVRGVDGVVVVFAFAVALMARWGAKFVGSLRIQGVR